MDHQCSKWDPAKRFRLDKVIKRVWRRFEKKEEIFPYLNCINAEVIESFFAELEEIKWRWDEKSRQSVLSEWDLRSEFGLNPRRKKSLAHTLGGDIYYFVQQLSSGCQVSLSVESVRWRVCEVAKTQHIEFSTYIYLFSQLRKECHKRCVARLTSSSEWSPTKRETWNLIARHSFSLRLFLTSLNSFIYFFCWFYKWKLLCKNVLSTQFLEFAIHSHPSALSLALYASYALHGWSQQWGGSSV